MTATALELADYFRARIPVPDEALVRLTAAARAGGSRWDDIASACGISTHDDLAGVIYRFTGETGAELLFSATQHALEQLEGSRRRNPPLTWPCPGCGQQITDRSASGRPVHIEHGHAAGCARLARDQAAEAQARRERLAPLILYSEPALGAVQRHRLAQRITDDCPRCGWHGYFFHHITIIDGDWAAGVCDDCYADLHPGITVTAQFFAVHLPDRAEPLAVIRQRTRSDLLSGALDSEVGGVWGR
jgi:predicted RNA-binding Zn-ribbon protein involved in translation (DUF1610 family)